MTDPQAWALVAFAVAALWLVLRYRFREREARRRHEREELRSRERMAALEQGMVPPEEPPSREPARDSAVSWESIVLGLGLVLSLAGIGSVVGLHLVPRTPEVRGLQEMASLGLIPTMAGIGLVLYWVLLQRSKGGHS